MLVENGELNGVSARVIILEIGTNNLSIGHDDPATVAAGVRNLVAATRAKQPSAKTLLLSIFPYDAPLPVAQTNAKLAALADGTNVVFLDWVRRSRRRISPTKIHPYPDGYRLWADAMLPMLEKLYRP